MRKYLIHFKKNEDIVILNQFDENTNHFNAVRLFNNCYIDTIISDRHLAYAVIDKDTEEMSFFITKDKAYLLLEE